MKKKIVVAVHSVVELDNHLPILEKIEENTRSLEFHILNISGINTSFACPFYQNELKKYKIINVYDYSDNNLLKFLDKIVKLSINLKFTNKILSGLERFVHFITTKSIGRDTKKQIKIFEHFDYIFICTAVLRRLVGKNRDSCDHLYWDNSNYEKIILAPETFAQWNEHKEFEELSDISLENGLEEIKYVLSVGLKNHRNCSYFKSAKIIDIGWPRYSKNWCKKMDKFLLYNQNNNYGDFILNLPSKVSPNTHWLREEIKKQMQFVLELSKNQNLKIITKRHPRCNIPKNILRVLKKHYFAPRGLNTSILVCMAKIIYSPGSSVLAHGFWKNKKIILDKAWADNLNQSFTYEDLCFIVEKDKKIIKKPKIIKKKEVLSFLNTQFQLGLTSSKYDYQVGKNIKLGLKDL